MTVYPHELRNTHDRVLAQRPPAELVTRWRKALLERDANFVIPRDDLAALVHALDASHQYADQLVKLAEGAAERAARLSQNVGQLLANEANHVCKPDGAGSWTA